MPRKPVTRRWHLAVALLILAHSLANCLDLTTYPVVSQDEVMLNDPARELAQHGILRTTVFGNRHDFERVYLFQPFGQALAMAAVYKLFGFGLVQTRLPGVFLAGACVWLLYYWVVRLSGSVIAGSLAGALLGLNPRFVLTSRLGRMDIFCILLLLTGLLCLTRLWTAETPGKTFRHVALAGLAMGAAVLMHLIAIEFLAATIVILAAWKGAPLTMRARHIAVFGLAAALPTGAWLWFALSHGRAAFENQFLHHGLLRSAMQTGFLERIPAELWFQLNAYARTPLFLLLYLAGGIWLFARKSGESSVITPLKILLVVTYGFNALVMGKTTGFYYLYPSLAASAATGLMFASILRRNPVPRTGLYAKALAAILVINSVAVIYGPRLLAWRYQGPERQYQTLESDLRQFDFAGKTVLGAGPEWYAMQKMGAHFEIQYLGFAAPDSTQQQYVIVNARDLDEAQPTLHDFDRIAEVGRPFPRIFGSQLTDYDYHLVVFRAKNLKIEPSR